MKRQKPMFMKDWFDEFTRWEKWWNRKMERLKANRELKKEVKGEWNDNV